MNFKTTYVLFGVLAALLIVLAVVLYQGPTPSAGGKKIFPSMHSRANPVATSDIQQIVFEKDGQPELTLERVDDKSWKITAPRELPADANRVDGLVLNLHSAEFDEDAKVPSLSVTGLKNPSRILRIQGKNREWTLAIGEVTPGEQTAVVYVLSSDRPNQPLSVSKRSLESALESLNYFRASNLLGSDTRDITDLKLSLGKKTPIELKKQGDRWRFVQPPYGAAEIDSLLNNVTGLNIDHRNDQDTDFVKDEVEKLAEYNLDPAKAEVLRVSITRGEGDKQTTATAIIGVSKKVGKANDKFYAALDEGKKKVDVVQVPASNVEPLLKLLDDPSTVRNKNLVVLDGFKQPDAIDIDGRYGKFEFRRANSSQPWEMYRGSTSYKIDESQIRQLIDEINKKDVVTTFPDAARKKELGLEKPEVTVTIWADSLEQAEEKKDDKKDDEKKDEKKEKPKPGKPAFKKGAEPVAVLRFGNREGSSVAVERVWGKESTIVLVPGTLLDLIGRGPLVYLDRSLPSFNPGSAEQDVTRLELTREGETYEIVRPDGKGPWKFVRPAAFKDRPAGDEVVRDILAELNRLTAREIESEKVDAKELASRFNLSPPVFRAVVTLTKDKQNTTHAFDFGKDAAGKGVYTKLGDRDMIFIVGPEVVETLRRELRELRVLNFDPAQVQTLKVSGWQQLLGEVGSRTFEQKDGKWVLKAPSGLKLNPEKVSSLVAGLSRLQADRFVPSGKGLKLEEGAVTFEITLADKKVLELTVGGEDGNAYFATTNQAKGDVYLVPRQLFEELRKAPAYFSQ